MRVLAGLSSTDVSAIADYIAATGGGTSGGDGCDDDCGGGHHTSRGSRPLTASTRNLRFGNEAVGSTSAAHEVTLTNATAAAVTLNTLATSGDYALAGGTCTQGGSLAAGASCTVDVTFSPKSSGWRTGTLRVALASSAVPTTITLQGRGTTTTGAAAALSSTSVVFAATPVTQTSAAQAITLSNPAGGRPLSLSGLTILGRAASDFSVASNCGSVLQPGAACVINVTYTPSGGAGTSTATLWVTSSARGAVAASLRGTAVALSTPDAAAAAAATRVQPATATSVLVASSPSLSFDPVASGSMSGELEVDLSNTSAAPVAVGKVSVAGGDFAVVADDCSGTTLPSGASCAMTVRFAPRQPGAQAGTLSVSTAGTDVAVVPLSGVGLAAQTTTADGTAPSGGGGALGPWGLLLAAGALLRRRRAGKAAERA